MSMPPSSNTPLIQNPIEQKKLLPEGEKKSAFGPLIGIIVIIVLSGFGALYFWGAYLNKQNSQQELPFIPGDNSTQQSG
jgi:hypothetical protein